MSNRKSEKETEREKHKKREGEREKKPEGEREKERQTDHYLVMQFEEQPHDCSSGSSFSSGRGVGVL